MTLEAHEIGEYTGCDHGIDGGRLYGCTSCAIRWHRRQYEQAMATANKHFKTLEALEEHRDQHGFQKTSLMEGGDAS